jgi:GH35 family endo-1,4-beta-xylanase
VFTVLLGLAVAAIGLVQPGAPAWARPWGPPTGGSQGQVGMGEGRLHAIDQTQPAARHTTVLVPLAFARYTAAAPTPPVAQVGGPFYLGAQTHLFWTDRPRTVALARDAGFAWLKQQVRWDAIEPRAKGAYAWRQLDAAVDAANAGGLRLLLSITAAPGWATGGNPIAGPPRDDQDFAAFMRALAQRYRGRVHAYEIWNEQNLWYEWGGKGRMDAGDYVRLLRLAYAAVKEADPAAIVVSGGLTPTGIDDGVTAIDDLRYLEEMYAAGLREVADAIGAHPHGYNNPPDDWIDVQTVPSPRFKGHPSFYFRRLEQYRALMERLGDADRPIWITEVGWTTANQAPGYEYGDDVSEEDQARYLVRAVEKARDEYPWVQALFVWNLNFATFTPPHDEKHPWSIVNADWSPRPAYRALQALPKSSRQIP